MECRDAEWEKKVREHQVGGKLEGRVSPEMGCRAKNSGVDM